MTNLSQIFVLLGSADGLAVGSVALRYYYFVKSPLRSIRKWDKELALSYWRQMDPAKPGSQIVWRELATLSCSWENLKRAEEVGAYV